MREQIGIVSLDGGIPTEFKFTPGRTNTGTGNGPVRLFLKPATWRRSRESPAAAKGNGGPLSAPAK